MFLLGIPLTGRPFVPHGLIFGPLFLKTYILKQFPGNARYFETFKPAGCTGQKSGSLIERIVHYRRSQDGYKVNRDLTPKYVNHSVAVFNRQISGCSMLNKSHQMSVICHCPGALKHTINTSRGSVEWHTLVYGITQILLSSRESKLVTRN